MGTVTRVVCDREDCVFYTTKPGISACFCTHAEKPHHIVEASCPLYRQDWAKADQGKMDELRKRFNRRR
jgi:hypothetical protein